MRGLKQISGLEGLDCGVIWTSLAQRGRDFPSCRNSLFSQDGEGPLVLLSHTSEGETGDFWSPFHSLESHSKDFFAIKHMVLSTKENETITYNAWELL